MVLELTTRHLIMLNNKIYRNTQIYLDKVLKKYGLGSGTYSYLFTLEKNEGISQNKISREIGHDKAMSARTITRLVELGYVYKEEDERDSRAYRLYLTAKAREIIPEIHKEIRILISLITENLSEEEKVTAISALSKIYDNTQRFKECEK